MPLRNVRGLLRTQEGTSNIPTRNIGSSSILQTIRLDTKTETRGEIQEYGLLQCTGFSDSSSSDRLTEEQENEIAENIYDWWISGKSYKQWYAEKFQQLKLDFGEF